MIPTMVIITSNPKTYWRDITFHAVEDCKRLKRVKMRIQIPIAEARKKYKPCRYCMPRERSRYHHKMFYGR